MMRDEPQAGYRPDPRILELADWLADPVKPAPFPQTVLRFRNDRHAASVGLAGLSDADWLRHFGRFEPLPGNLPQPLALRYHGHQFRVYNPHIGDGRGFLFAQLRDRSDRLLDFGTKGSGQTPWSRQGDGRLTLKGAVREILATEMLEALGVNTSKTFSVIETGEELWRGDEPSPTRSAVLVRLSHGHIRIGTFQRLAALEEADHMAALVEYALENFPGPPPLDAPDGGFPGSDEPAVRLLHLVVERMADMAASYMVAGFVHGVLNTDNMNISGESFDYGPWRWLPQWDPSFTAAYFDHTGLYAFGRQGEAMGWNCAQLAGALLLIASEEPLESALARYPQLFRQSLTRRFVKRLGVSSRGVDEDLALFGAADTLMRTEGLSPDALFFAHRAGRNPPANGFGKLLRKHAPAAGLDHPLWAEASPPTMVIDEVERVWAAIDTADDWRPLAEKVETVRALGAALGAQMHS